MIGAGILAGRNFPAKSRGRKTRTGMPALGPQHRWTNFARTVFLASVSALAIALPAQAQNTPTTAAAKPATGAAAKPAAKADPKSATAKKSVDKKNVAKKADSKKSDHKSAGKESGKHAAKSAHKQKAAEQNSGKETREIDNGFFNTNQEWRATAATAADHESRPSAMPFLLRHPQQGLPHSLPLHRPYRAMLHRPPAVAPLAFLSLKVQAQQHQVTWKPYVRRWSHCEAVIRPRHCGKRLPCPIQRSANSLNGLCCAPTTITPALRAMRHSLPLIQAGPVSARCAAAPKA